MALSAPGSLMKIRDPAARSARLPTVAWRAARVALDAAAPVLVQVPRRGYLPTLACARCRAPARCLGCAGPIGQPSGGRPAVPTCRRCGRLAGEGCALGLIGCGRGCEHLDRGLRGG